MSKKRNLVEELLKRHCLITPESYEVLEDLDDDSLDVDGLAEALKDEIVVTADKLRGALSSFEGMLSDGDMAHADAVLGKSERDSSFPQQSIKDDVQVLDAILESVTIKTKKERLELKKPPSTKEIFQSSKGKEFFPLGKKIAPQVKVLSDSTGRAFMKGILEDFSEYFLSRYEQMSRILRARGDITGCSKIGELEKLKLQENETITIIGMVTEKRGLRSGGLMFDIEDPSGRITVTIPKKMQELVIKAGALLEDQVAAFYGRLVNDRFIADDFVLPDVPLNRTIKAASDPVSVCMTSDLHIGSEEFLEDSFNSFIDFLNGRVDDPYQKTIASEIKYLIIGGDLVDGVGIYPKQEEDLIITDIYEQYNHAAELLSKIPKWIQIIIISGNHDACRQALPQPAIGKEFAPKLWEMPNIKLLSNPTTVEIHGRTFLLYHGNSFEDIASLTPGLSLNDPKGPMINTLRFRHLSPTFGRRSSLVPSMTDELVIEKIPDVYHTGHIHIYSYTRYRGVECINSGTFQSQTEYMETRNIQPTPGIVPIFNLKTNKMHKLIFYEPEEEKS